MLVAPYPYLLLLFPATVLARDDFRARRVEVVWLVVLGIAALAAAWLSEGWRAMWQHTLCNALLSVLLLGLLALWIRVRHRQPLRRFRTHWFGAGDWAMMLAVAPLFSPETYIRFLLVACIAALGWWYLLRSDRRRTIPLAGFMAVTLIGYSLFRFFISWQ